MVEGGLKGRGAVIHLFERRSIVTFVAYHSRRVPQTRTLNAAQRTLQGKLRSHLVASGVLFVGSAHSAFHVLSDDERTSSGKAAPPLDEFLVVGRAVTNFPIELGHGIIHPTFVNPVKHIGIKVVVVLQSGRF